MPGPTYTVTDVLQSWWIGAVAFAVSLVVTPIVRFVAYRTRIVDRPDDLLKPHGRPIAYMGGLAMFAGLLTGLGAYVAVMPDRGLHWQQVLADLPAARFSHLMHNPLWSLIAIALACLAITVMGLIDDIRGLTPRQKVYWQVACAVILLAGGVGDQIATIFLSQITPPSFWPTWFMMPLSAVMCMVLVIATCNATNLLDGLDGLCGGVTGIIALGFLALAVWLAMWGRTRIEVEYDSMRVALCLAMAGAILGFLPYNIPPASIFMGDAGSMLLGFFVATMMAMFCNEGTGRWLMAAIVVYSLPIADTALAVVRRLLSHKSIFAGDRSHLYDQLVDRGMTVKQVVVLFYVLATAAAALGVTLAVLLRGRYALPIYAAIAILFWVVVIAAGMVRPPPRRASSGPDAQDQA